MPSVVAVYGQLASAPNDKTRAHLIAEAFERVAKRYPEVKELVIQSGVQEKSCVRRRRSPRRKIDCPLGGSNYGPTSRGRSSSCGPNSGRKLRTFRLSLPWRWPGRRWMPPSGRPGC